MWIEFEARKTGAELGKYKSRLAAFKRLAHARRDFQQEGTAAARRVEHPRT